MQKNLVGTLFYLVKYLKIPVTKSSIIREVEKSPNNESLFGISTVLDKWHINNAAYRLSVGELESDLCPFIVTIKNDMGLTEFAVAQNITNVAVVLSNERWNKKAMPREQFERIFTGVILAVEVEVEADADAGELNYKLHRKKEIINNLRIPFLWLSGLILVFAISMKIGLGNIRLDLILITKSLGILFSSLLLAKSMAVDSAFLKKICKGTSHIDCDSILYSKGANLTSWLSWSEIGLFYFAGTISLLVFQNKNELIQLSAYINAISLPYIIFSIEYQAFVIKKWCMLCCIVQLCLITEFILNLNYLSATYGSVGLMGYTTCIISLLVPVMLWVFIKPLLLASRRLKRSQIDLSRLKFNEGLFNKILKDQPAYTLPDKDHSIILGNPNSEKVITLVSDPYCGPCSKAHRDIDQLLRDSENIQVRLILKNSSNNGEINKHLLTLNRLSGSTVKRAILEWYEDDEKDFLKWASKFPVVDDGLNGPDIIYQREWFSAANVPFTPLIIVNGHQLPEPYLIEDLLYLI